MARRAFTICITVFDSFRSSLPTKNLNYSLPAGFAFSIVLLLHHITPVRSLLGTECALDYIVYIALTFA